ncbi:uncharacterized protein EAF02_006728 [Botrytis sinoallii]|uniref:uncharacterized protein n=1 Tax=Botrytis sinoallii TaxID=1463999 RepID=UPI001901A756|nr:uncharacterized protein EAF02_006728 [Botrytis sinoallii]KAF7880837.1 hypothetical protein EAF02_006728 [Botrytis sinoallii]
MLKRPAAAGMSSSMGPAKKQRRTKPVVKDYMSLSKDDLISKKNHLEVVQLLMDLRGAYQQLQVEYRKTKQDLIDKEDEAEEYSEEFEKLKYELPDIDQLEVKIAKNEKLIDILLKDNKDYKETYYDYKKENDELKILNEENARKITRLEAQIAKVASKPRKNTAAAKRNSFDVRQQAEQIQEVMRSRKTFVKRWSYTCIVPSADVFYTLFNMDTAAELGAKKQWKQKKINIDDFRDIVGRCYVFKVGYPPLEPVGKDVILRWDAGGNSITVSGKYGVPGMACPE